MRRAGHLLIALLLVVPTIAAILGHWTVRHCFTP